jgi:hypothetical protein
VSKVSAEVFFEDHGSYLIATVAGPWEATSMNRDLETIRHEAERRGYSQVLVDAYGVAPARSALQKYEFGISIAERWSGFRAAFLRQAEYLDGMVENTAVNRGANIATFSNRDEAVQWLKRGNSPA